MNFPQGRFLSDTVAYLGSSGPHTPVPEVGLTRAVEEATSHDINATKKQQKTGGWAKKVGSSVAAHGMNHSVTRAVNEAADGGPYTACPPYLPAALPPAPLHAEFRLPLPAT